jgi:predicted membrane protein
MMQITYSLIFIVISTLIYWLLLPAKWRNIFLLAVSLFFMSLFSIKYTLYLFLNVLLVYIAGTYIKRGEKNRKLLLLLIRHFWLTMKGYEKVETIWLWFMLKGGYVKGVLFLSHLNR